MPPDVLQRAAELLREGHSSGSALARKSDGRACAPTHSEATSWSLHGALMRAAHELQYDYVLQSARLQVAGVVWDRYGLLLAWAELSPNFTADDALECVLQALAVGS